jgi:hypothetical protein
MTQLSITALKTHCVLAVAKNCSLAAEIPEEKKNKNKNFPSQNLFQT